MEEDTVTGRRTIALLVGVVALLAAACGGGGSAQNTAGFEPTKDIKWIVPYKQGGGFDAYSRGLAQTMSKEGFLPDGINVAVENVTPFAEGVTQMFTAKPDGYTLGILPMPAAIAQQIQFPDLAKWNTPDFTVLGSIEENAYVIYVAGNGPYKTIQDLQAAKGLKSITVEKGSSSSIANVVATQTLGLDAQITFGAEGSEEAATALIRGDVDYIVYGTTDLVGFVKSGDIKPVLFLGTEEQRPAMFDWLKGVPSMADAGHPEAAGAVTELRVVVGPPGLPADVTTYLTKSVQDAMGSDAFKQWAEQAGRDIIPRTADSARSMMESQITTMKELVPKLVQEGLL